MIVNELARNWWALTARGVLAVLFGVLTFAWPGITLLTLAWVFAAYALAGGVLAVVAALAGRTGGFPWWALLVEGLLGIAAGVVAMGWPGIYLLALLYLIAGWAAVTGVFQVIVALRLRKEIEGEWALVAGGILSVAFGVLLVVYPGAGFLYIAYMLGAYALIAGVLLIVLSLRLRRFSTRTESPA